MSTGQQTDESADSERGVADRWFILSLLLLNYFVLMAWPNWYTVGWWNVWNVVILAVAARTGAGDDEEDLVETS